MIDINANDTHPDAKPLADRERDDIRWGIASFNPIHRGSAVFIVTMNGDDVAGPMNRDMAREIVRRHNATLEA
jgi:hypothetical protein